MDKQVLQRAVSFIEPWLSIRLNRIDIPGFVVAIAHEGNVVFHSAC